jgi:hypothetical protein
LLLDDFQIYYCIWKSIKIMSELNFFKDKKYRPPRRIGFYFQTGF